MAYKFSQLNKLGDEFRSVFGIGFKPFYDGLISVASKCLCIDILKFDEWLHQQHGNYEDEGKSMDDIIREHYGEKGVELINEVTDMGETLTKSIVEIDGVKTVAERTVRKEQVTYKPYGNYHEGLDVNQVVYDLMIIACYDMMTVGTVLYGGDYTAAEMAGKIGYLHQYVEGGDYKVIKIETKTFCCTYHVSEAFAQIAEWEGVAGISPAKAHRFHVDGKEMPKGAVLKKYQRCHGYKPTHISLVMDERRVNEKFEVLGRLYQSLTSEGMRRAMSVCAAARLFDNKSYEVQALVKSAMRWKLWRDYAKKEGASMMPVAFDETDFQCGPECYKQVDSRYVQELVNHWQKLLSDYPMPEWPKQGDMVQFKAHDIQKKYRGKYLCEGMTASLSTYGDSLVWRASLRVKKYDNEYFTPSLLEPVKEKTKKGSGLTRTKTDKKPAVKKKCSGLTRTKTDGERKESEKVPLSSAAKTKTQKSAAVKVKGTDYTVKSDGRTETFGSYIPGALAETQPSDIEHQTSIAERLRQALLARLAA